MGVGVSPILVPFQINFPLRFWEKGCLTGKHQTKTVSKMKSEFWKSLPKKTHQYSGWYFPMSCFREGKEPFILGFHVSKVRRCVDLTTS